MKRKILSSALALFLLAALPLRVYAADLLIPGGQIIGLELQNDTVTVAAFDDGYGAAAREAGLRVGDTIIKMDATPVHSAADVKMALRRCDGDVEITVLRGSKEESITLSPCQTKEGPQLECSIKKLLYHIHK